MRLSVRETVRLATRFRHLHVLARDGRVFFGHLYVVEELSGWWRRSAFRGRDGDGVLTSIRARRRVKQIKMRTRVCRSSNLGNSGRSVQVFELRGCGFVSRVTLLLREVDVNLDFVGDKRVVDRGSNRIYSRRVGGRYRVEVDAVEVGGERVVHRLGQDA